MIQTHDQIFIVLNKHRGVSVMVVKDPIDLIALILVIIGGLNWGFVGLLNFNLVATVFGARSKLARLVYVIVGLSALDMIYFAMKDTTKDTAKVATH
jgi:uncharacterized protein